MIALLQILKLLNEEQREGLKSFLLEPDEGFGPDDLIDSLPDFLFNHFGLEYEMRDRERESLIRILENGSASSAFNLVA